MTTAFRFCCSLSSHCRSADCLIHTLSFILTALIHTHTSLPLIACRLTTIRTTL